MYQFLYLMAPAAISVLVMHYLMKKQPGAISALLEWFAFSILNNVCVLVLMIPFEKAMLIFGEDGSVSVQYGTVAILFAIVLAVIMGVIFAFIGKNIQLRVQIEDEDSKEAAND